MPFVVARDTVTLHPPAELGFGPDEYITIQQYQTAGIRQRVMQRALAVTMTGGSANPSMAVDVFTYRAALLEEIVVAWSDPTPVSPDSLAQIPVEVQDWISEQFDALNAARSDAEKNDSDGSSSPGLPQPAGIKTSSGRRS